MREILSKLGLPEYDTKILLYLIEAGKYADAKDISKNASVPLTRIYSIMLKLAKQGLIRTMPGKINLYAAPQKAELVKSIRTWKQSQIDEQKASVDAACTKLANELSGFRKNPEDVNVTYFHDNAAYWKDYLQTESSLKAGDIHRIINNVRLCAGFIDEELACMPREQAKVMRGEGVEASKAEIHYIINPQSIVRNTIRDLKDKNKVAASLRQALGELKRESYYSKIFTGTDTSNILIAIEPASVFMEFYGDESCRIASAIKIENKSVASDFAKWFDALASKCEKASYEDFKAEIEKWARKLAGIEL